MAFADVDLQQGVIRVRRAFGEVAGQGLVLGPRRSIGRMLERGTGGTAFQPRACPEPNPRQLWRVGSLATPGSSRPAESRAAPRERRDDRSARN